MQKNLQDIITCCSKASNSDVINSKQVRMWAMSYTMKELTHFQISKTMYSFIRLFSAVSVYTYYVLLDQFVFNYVQIPHDFYKYLSFII